MFNVCFALLKTLFTFLLLICRSQIKKPKVRIFDPKEYFYWLEPRVRFLPKLLEKEGEIWVKMKRWIWVFRRSKLRWLKWRSYNYSADVLSASKYLKKNKDCGRDGLAEILSSPFYNGFRQITKTETTFVKGMEDSKSTAYREVPKWMKITWVWKRKFRPIKVQ